MKASPACTLTVAIALALPGGCAVAPSPARSPDLSPAASASSTSSPAASASPPRLASAPLFVAWELRGDGARLIIVRDGTVDRIPLPAVPNGPVAAGVHGPFAFLSAASAQPVMWTSRGSLAEPQWDAVRLVPPESLDAPLVWLCISSGSPPRVTVQSDDNRVYVVDDDGMLRSLPASLLMLRPGGCAWSDRQHVVVPTDAPQPPFHIAFAMFDVDTTTSRLVPGNGGEAPAVSDVSLGYVARDQTGRQVVWIGAIPGADGPLPPPDLRIAPDAPDVDFFHPVLSADGRGVAVVELARPAAPRRLLVYDLSATPTMIMELDVRGASDAGPVWVANAQPD